MQEPVQVLTPLFLQGLRRSVGGSTLALFFDTYERTAAYLDRWIRDVLSGQYGIVPGKIVISIAGQHELRRNHWEPHERIVARLRLDPFTPEEAREYLTHKGVANPEVIDTILQLSGRVPVLVATLAAGNPTDAAEVGDPTGTAVERYLKWVDDAKQRQLVLDASLPRKLNRDVVGILTGDHDGPALFEWLRGMPFCQDRGAEAAGWTYHSLVRAQMLRYKYREAPRSWGESHSRLAEYYDCLRESLQLSEQEGLRDASFQSYLLESLYHRLCQAPHKCLSISLNHFLTAFSTDRSLARRVAITISDAGADAANPELREWGGRLLNGTDAYQQQDGANAIRMFTALLEGQALHPQQRSIALGRRGHLYRETGQYEKALLDLDEALRIEPDEIRHLRVRSLTFSELGQHDRALADRHKAMTTKPDDADLLADRAREYRALGRYDDAVADLDRALEIDPRYAWALSMRGNVYSLLGRYEEALIDLTSALEIDPTDVLARIRRAVVYQRLGRYEEELQDLTNLLEIGPNYCAFHSLRGRVLSDLGRYKEALSDFTSALEADPRDDSALANRGRCYHLMGRYEEALVDLTSAVEINPQSAWSVGQRAQTYLVSGKFQPALSDINQALGLVPNDRFFRYVRALIYRILGSPEMADRELEAALRIAREDYDRDRSDWPAAICVALFQLADGDSSAALDTYQEALDRGCPVGFVLEATHYLTDFINLFPDTDNATSIRERLQDYTADRL